MHVLGLFFCHMHATMVVSMRNASLIVMSYKIFAISLFGYFTALHNTENFGI